MRTKKALLGIMMTIAVTAAAVGCGTAPAPTQSEKTTAAGTETASQDAMTASHEAGRGHLLREPVSRDPDPLQPTFRRGTYRGLQTGKRSPHIRRHSRLLRTEPWQERKQ